MKKESKIGYMCGVTFQHDFCKDNPYGVEIFGSIKSLKKYMKCTKECGIVKVKVIVEKWETKQTLKGENNGTK